MPSTLPQQSSLLSHLSLDLLILILRNSIFHPFVASLIPVCLCAGGAPYTSPAVLNTVVYASLICFLWALVPLSENLAYGPPRRVSEDDELVVITGGASGLGACLAEIYAHRGWGVVVLDLKEPVDAKLENEGVKYYRCDLADEQRVDEVWKQVIDEVGIPTILINNAGILQNQSVLDNPSVGTSFTQRLFQVNTLAPITLISLFLHTLQSHDRHGTLVTISSVLGRLGAARLASYTASKAALIAFHNSLTADIRNAGKAGDIKTLLVTPGQLATEMFKDIKQNACQRFVGPVVEVQRLAMKIVTVVGEGRGGVIAEPAYARWVGVLELLPVGIVRILRDLAGVDTAMQMEGGQ